MYALKRDIMKNKRKERRWPMEAKSRQGGTQSSSRHHRYKLEQRYFRNAIRKLSVSSHESSKMRKREKSETNSTTSFLNEETQSTITS